MASFDEALNGMYDARLRPLLLSSIISNHLPDDRQPPKPPSELSIVISMIRRHHLLSEPRLTNPSPKSTDAYKIAIESWIERLNSMLQSTMTEKCWAGVGLLGLTCQECTRQRFLDSYVSWFQKLVVHLKPTDPLFVRGAAYASLTDLLSRLASIGVKREGTSLSVKLVQPVLLLLSEQSSKSIWNNGIDLLLTMLKCFPASVKQQSSQVEALLVSKLMEVDITAPLSKKFARCLALLPKAHGDAASWNSLFRRILHTINSHLDDAFLGMEDGMLAKKVQNALMPRGQEQSWFLGGTANSITEGCKTFWQQLVPRISVLLQCCHYLLVNSFPVQVPVPLTALLATITRILAVDGSPYHSGSGLGTPISVVQQVSLCCELPALHSCALDLLHATLCGVRSQLLPRGADIVRLLTEYFRRCGLPSLRVKLYNISKHLLITLGVGMASELAPALIENLLADLKGTASVLALSSMNSAHAHACAQGISNSGHARKRKVNGSIHVDMVSPICIIETGLDMTDSSCGMALQIAALEAMKALLTVGGSLRSEQWRMEVDSVVANVALIASEESLSPSLIFEDTSCKEESLAFASGAFQLAAYQAFLASILSPCTHRPPFLSQALSVFRKGRQEAAGTEVAEFCAHALLALEPLIHPRSLPFAPATASIIPSGKVLSSITENSGPPMQRFILPLQGLAPSTSPNVNNHSFSTHLPPLKVNTSGMQIEVEGDPFVQEDIESWIVDYGGEQVGLHDGSSMMVEGFNDEFQVINNIQRGLGNVSARQSLADDEDRVMMSMVGDILGEPREINNNPRVEIPRAMSIVGDMLNESMEIQRAMVGEIQRTMVGNMAMESQGAMVGEITRTSEMSGENLPSEMMMMMTSGKFSMNEMGSQVAGSIYQPSSDVIDPQSITTTTATHPSSASIDKDIAMTSLSAINVGNASSAHDIASASHSLSESDSDAIPDIVDGDPDTD